jgi:HEAT repeat protein
MEARAVEMATEQIELEKLVENLEHTPGPIPFSLLYGLSDLSGERLHAFCDAWDAFPGALRQQVIGALVELGEASFEVHFDPIFLYCLQDPDEEVRALAVEGLWESDQVALIGSLLSMLRSDPSARVRAAAAAGLGRFVLAGELEELEQPIQARIVTELLTALHLAGESVDVRRRAVEAVSYACTPETSEAITLAYYDDDEEMRLSAVVGMGRSCDARWREILLEELESSSPAMRYEAAWACGELMLRQAVPGLSQLLDDPDLEVRNAAIWALGQVGGEQAKCILLAAYEDADEDTQEALEDALAEQALLEGEVEFMLVDVEDEWDDAFGDELDDLLYRDACFPLWGEADEEDEEENEEADLDDYFWDRGADQI